MDFGETIIMREIFNQKIIKIFLPILAVVVAIISIVGVIIASNKPEYLDVSNHGYQMMQEDIGLGENASEESGVEIKHYTLSGCKFSGGGAQIVVKGNTNYEIKDCIFSGSTNTALKIEGGEVTLENCQILNGNTTDDGSANNITGGTLNLNNVKINNSYLISLISAVLVCFMCNMFIKQDIYCSNLIQK